MFKQNEYREEDFSDHYNLYKGKERNISLNGWIFDRFNQIFYMEKDTHAIGEVVAIRWYNDKWLLTLCNYANVIFSESYDDLADAFAEGNKLLI